MSSHPSGLPGFCGEVSFNLPKYSSYIMDNFSLADFEFPSLCLSLKSLTVTLNSLLRASRSARGSRLEPFHVIPENASNLAYKCNLLDPQEHVRAFQSLYGRLISFIFPLNFRPSFCLSLMLNNYH